VADADLPGQRRQVAPCENEFLGKLGAVGREPAQPRRAHRAVIAQAAAGTFQPHRPQRLGAMQALFHGRSELHILKKRKPILR
jgi:hypothetical protein